MDLRYLCLALFAFATVPLACSGQHRKVTGPPPEYELPEAPDAWTPAPALPESGPPRDAGTQ